MRGGARRARAGRAARLRASATSRSSCSSWAARSPRRSPSSTAASSTASAARPGRSGCAPPARSTAKWRISPARCSKDLLFGGGAATIAGTPGCLGRDDCGASDATRPARLGGVPRERRESRRGARRLGARRVRGDPVGPAGARGGVRDELTSRLARVIAGAAGPRARRVRSGRKQAAQGAALHRRRSGRRVVRDLVDALRIREASGTVLDHLYVIDAEAARVRLGIV